MYDDQQERPPWLRNLRPKRELEVASPAEAPVAEPVFEAAVGEAARWSAAQPTLGGAESPPAEGRLNRRHLLILALVLWANVGILGCLCLLVTGRLVP